MVSIPKSIGVIACSVVLGLSLSNAAQARMSSGPCADSRISGEPNLLKCDADTMAGIETIKGEVLRVDDDTYLIMRYDGKEMTLHIEPTTKMSGRVGKGDRIGAKVGEAEHLRHVLSLRQLK